MDEAQSLEDQAHQAVVDWLTKENPTPGQPVPVREFARQLGMSRTPVRSALGRLFERGLLSYDPAAGFTVAVPELSTLYELFELRLMIESHSLRVFAERPDLKPPEILRPLANEAQQLAANVVRQPELYIGFRNNDSAFHRTLVRMAGLPKLLAMYDDLHLSIHVTRAGLEAPLTQGRLDAAVDEHMAIVDALEDGERERARELLEAHILRVRDQTIVFLSRPRL